MMTESQRTIEDIYEDLVRVLDKMDSSGGCDCMNSCTNERNNKENGLSLKSRMIVMESIMNECHSKLEDIKKKMGILEKMVSRMEEPLQNSSSQVDTAKAMTYINIDEKTQ